MTDVVTIGHRKDSLVTKLIILTKCDKCNNISTNVNTNSDQEVDLEREKYF